jgi:hypothetical protein
MARSDLAASGVLFTIATESGFDDAASFSFRPYRYGE